MASRRGGDPAGAGGSEIVGVLSRRAALLALALMVACSSGAAAQPTPTPSPSLPAQSPSPSPSPEPLERAERSLPAPIEETAAAAAGGRLYVMGGFNEAGASLSTVYVFDGASWTAGPRLPLPLDHPAAATLDGQLYIAGGHSNGRDSARLFRLDGDRWTELAPMHFARGSHALIAAAGKLYAIGGNTNSGNVPPGESFDPGADAWHTTASLPQPRNHVAGFALANAVCVAGGRSPTTARVDCLQLQTGVWSRTFGDIPRATSGGSAATFDNGAVIVAGGEDASETRIVDQFVFARGATWVQSQKMLLPRHGFELAIFEGRAWACGGGSAPGLHPVATCTSFGDPSAADG